MLKTYFNSNYKEDPIRQLRFDTAENICFFYGASHYPSAGNDAKSMKDIKKILFMSEENYDFSHIESSTFDKVFIIHKGVDKWRNAEINRNLYEYVYFPIPERVANQEIDFNNKKYDVVYAGHLGPQQLWVLDLVTKVKSKKYAFVSASDHQMITHKNVSYEDKINVLCQSKVAIVHNIHFCNINSANKTLVNSMKKNVESFKNCESWYNQDTKNWRDTRPELKTRIFESAACGCIPLVLEDDFKSVEDFFLPNEDFLYFNKENFEEKLNEVLNNYEKYKHIAISAKEKCIKYTDKEFSKTYLQNL